MQIIPFQTGPASYNIFVVLEDANLARLREYDPAQLGIDKLPAKWASLRLDTVIIGYGDAKDCAQAAFLLHGGEVVKALKFLSRGFVFDPSRGDTDEPYVSALSKTEEGTPP